VRSILRWKRGCCAKRDRRAGRPEDDGELVASLFALRESMERGTKIDAEEKKLPATQVCSTVSTTRRRRHDTVRTDKPGSSQIRSHDFPMRNNREYVLLMRGFFWEVSQLWRNTGRKFGGKLQKKQRLAGRKKLSHKVEYALNYLFGH
jgi:hypothetical protein